MREPLVPSVLSLAEPGCFNQISFWRSVCIKKSKRRESISGSLFPSTVLRDKIMFLELQYRVICALSLWYLLHSSSKCCMFRFVLHVEHVGGAVRCGMCVFVICVWPSRNLARHLSLVLEF